MLKKSFIVSSSPTEKIFFNFEAMPRKVEKSGVLIRKVQS